MLEWIKCIELYNCLGSTVFGSSAGVFLGVGIGGGTGWKDRILVFMEHVGAPVSSLGNYNDVRGRLYLYLIFYKIWGNGVN